MYKILIVDDEMVFRRGIRAMLQKSDFCIGKIAEAADGFEAMEILERDSFDIVITDIRMPRMDGLMLCRSIRERKMLPGIVIMSGYDDFKYAQAAIKYGVSDYVLKPVSQKKLFEVLGEVMGKLDRGANRLEYEKMDSLVTGLYEALWNRDRDACQRIKKEAQDSLCGIGANAREEILQEILLGAAGKVSRQLGQQLPEDAFEEHDFEENLEILWEMVSNRKRHGLLETVREHLTENPAMSQEELCSLLGFSSSHFSLAFKEKTGKKFVDYRTEIRMEAAKKQLCIPSKTVTQVAAEVGYSDYSHFSSVFKRFYGKTPAQFREERGLSL